MARWLQGMFAQPRRVVPYGPPRLEGACTCMACAALYTTSWEGTAPKRAFYCGLVVVNRALDPSEGDCSDMNGQKKTASPRLYTK